MRIIQAKTLGEAMKKASRYLKLGRGIRISKVNKNYEIKVVAKYQQ